MGSRVSRSLFVSSKEPKRRSSRRIRKVTLVYDLYARARVSNYSSFRRGSRRRFSLVCRIETAFANSFIPADVREAVRMEYDALCEGDETTPVAVRSSAVGKEAHVPRKKKNAGNFFYCQRRGRRNELRRRSNENFSQRSRSERRNALRRRLLGVAFLAPSRSVSTTARLADRHSHGSRRSANGACAHGRRFVYRRSNYGQSEVDCN